MVAICHLSLARCSIEFSFFLSRVFERTENSKIRASIVHFSEVKIALRRPRCHFFRVFDTFDNSSHQRRWFSIWVGNKHSRGNCLFPSRLNSPSRLYFHSAKTKRNETNRAAVFVVASCFFEAFPSRLCDTTSTLLRVNVNKENNYSLDAVFCLISFRL